RRGPMNDTSRVNDITRARTAGALWLAVIVTGMVGFSVARLLVVRGDAAATAARILASEGLYRLGFASTLVAGVCYMGVTAILYVLLKPIGPTRSALAAFFGLAGIAVGAAAAFADLATLVLLHGGDPLSALTPAQRQSLAYAVVRVEEQFMSVGMVVSGSQCVLAGTLLARSMLVPRILGGLLAVGGSSYIINSFTNFLSPEAGARVAPFIIPAALIGEGSLTLWLLVKGVCVLPPEHRAARRA